MSTKKLTLTARQTEMIRILAKFNQDAPATAADIAQELNVSTRTVLREMTTIEKWLTQNEFQFIRKPGVGLALVGRLDQLALLLDGYGSQQSHSKEERRHRILSELLLAQEPMKGSNLAHSLQISESTLVSDLDVAQQWFATYGVTLHRRPGLGLYLESSEPHLRHAMVGVLLEDLQESLIIDLLEGANALIQPQIMSQVADVLTAIAKERHFHYTDRGYMALALYLAVTAHRVQQGYGAEDVSTDQDLAEFPVATAIANQLELPQQEIYWIARELVSAISRTDDGQPTDQMDRLPLRQLVLKMIAQVEERLIRSFGQSQLLVDDLVRHMEPALCRLQLGIPVKNTHVQEIKTQYPQIYQATELACDLLKEPTGTSKIPESEIAFIAMHFCAATERVQTAQRNITAVIVCPTGVGMSRILAANLAKHCKQIQIHSVVSVMRLTPQWLEEQGVDLVITTVKLTIDYPHLCVHPGLRHQDRLLLDELCQRIATQPEKVATAPIQTFHLRNTIDYVEALGQEILRLVGRVTLQTLEQVADKSELIQAAAALFTQGEFAQSIIRSDLEAREAISETYIDEGQMLLLHCRTAAVNCCQLGYLRLERPLVVEDKIIAGAIVMLIHQNPTSAHAEMMGQISAAFLDHQGLYLAVKQGTVADFAGEIEGILGGYYRSILRQLSDL